MDEIKRQERKNQVKKMLKEFRYVLNRKQKFQVLGLLVLIIIGSFMELIGVAIFLPFIQILMDPEAALADYDRPYIAWAYQAFHASSVNSFLIMIALLICAVYVIKNLYLSFMQNSILSFTYRTRMGLATRLLDTYMHEPYSFHLKTNIAEMQKSLTTDAQQFMLLLNNLLQTLAELTMVAAIVAYLFHTSHAITLMVAVLLLVFIGAFTYASKHISGRVGKQNEQYNIRLNQWVNQALGGIKEVKVLHREEYFVGAYRNYYGKLIRGAKLNEMLATIPKYLLETVCIVGMLLAVIIKLEFGQDVAMTTFIPQLTAFAVASFRILPSVGKLNSYISNINYCAPSLDFIYQDLKGIEEFKESLRTEDEKENLSFQNAVHVKDICFHYSDADTNVIDHVSFEIPKGKTVALVGSSGAGKTTLADIILGLHTPQSGDILVDDWSIQKNPNAWHRLLGYIPQTIYLTDDTIRRNIAFGVKEEEIDDKAVQQAIHQAQLDEFIEELPKGLETFVGDRGVRISGGQRQRIGIARALYQNPEILVMDEATSALDNETETAVMESIHRLQGEKTMIIIAHRLTTIRNADLIYEVGDGGIQLRSKEELGIV